MTESLFNETELRIIIPNHTTQKEDHDPVAIIESQPRGFAFYGKVSKSTIDDMETTQSFFNSLEITIDATLSDPTPLMNKSTSATTVTQSVPNSPKIVQRRPNDTTTPFFTQVYNRSNKNSEFMLFEHEDTYCCLYPMVIPIVYAKTKSIHPLLSLNANIQYRPLSIKRIYVAEPSQEDETEYDTDLFETINLLSGLTDDPVFAEKEPPLQKFVMENHRQSHPSSSTSTTTHIPTPQINMKRSVNNQIPVRSGLVVKIRTTNASMTDKMVMMSVEIENPNEAGCEFVVDKVEVQVSNAVVSMSFNPDKETVFPILLNKSDLIVFVYDVTVLDDGSVKSPVQNQRMFPSRRPPIATSFGEDRIQPQRVSIQIYGSPVIQGVKAMSMRSKWNTMLDVTAMCQRREEVTPDKLFNNLMISTQNKVNVNSNMNSPGARSIIHSPGAGTQPSHQLDGIFGMKQYAAPVLPPNKEMLNQGGRRVPEKEVADGIVVSFTVPDSIAVGKVFPLHIFIVNRSKYTRRFQVMIPNRKRQPTEFNHAVKTNLPPLPVEPTPIGPFMDESEFLRQYFENETHEADIICLENNVRLSPLGKSTSQCVDIQFIAVKEKLHSIDLIQLVDQDTGFVTNLRNVLEVYVEQRENPDE
ncbi:TRAPP trafficking subunit Trs65-domain-containing protein [Pilobolus umbonatus]|nr:TRAPP trafficking subunit Trs65-domain-containing protein [Pilobolus umbonatus]